MILTLLNYYEYPLTMLAILLAFLSSLAISMPFHEFAHAHIALKEGDGTAKALKRHTIAPLSHIDLTGLFMLLIFGIGFAKPVPIDSRNFKRGTKSKILVSLAGVVTNLLLGIIGCFLYVMLFKIWPDLFNSYGFISELYYYFFTLFIELNFMFVFFNILPIYPLDGAKVIDALAGENNKFSQFMKRYGLFIMLFLLVTGLLSAYINFMSGNLINWLINLFRKLFRI